MKISSSFYLGFLLEWKKKWPFFFTQLAPDALTLREHGAVSEEAAREIMLTVLSHIGEKLNNKPAGQHFRRFLPAVKALLSSSADQQAITKQLTALLGPLHYYSQHCLNTCAAEAAAQEKFMTDLCHPPVGEHAAHKNRSIDQIFYELPAYIWQLANFYLPKLPAYQASDFLIESLRAQVKNSNLHVYSVLNDPQAEQYGYPQAAKAILAAGMAYAEMSTYSYIPCSMLFIAEQEIDCSRLTRSPTVNQSTQQILKIVLPYAAMLGAYYAQSEDAPLSSVAMYAAMGFVFLRGGQKACDWLQQGGHFIYKKVTGIQPAQHAQTSLSSFLWKQTLHAGGMALFHYLIPPAPWLRAPGALVVDRQTPVQSGCADNIDARDQAAKMLELDPDAGRKEISARVRKLGWELYHGNKGNPRDLERAMEINQAKDCMLEYASYEKSKYQL